MIPSDVEARIKLLGPERVERIHVPELALTAYIVLDSTILGPAAGGVRTRAYENEAAAATDACRLARAMTYKCALGGLDAGGGKIVVMDRPDLSREAAFEVIGHRIDSLEGDMRAAGDLGTTEADLRGMARHTRYVHTETARLAGAVARGVLRCTEACADVKGRPGLSGLSAAVQGCGDIGAAVAEAFIEAGAAVRVADVVEGRARALADRIGATVVSPADVLFEDVDILSPCAVGDVITSSNAGSIRAWAVCGGANNICENDEADLALHRRGVICVPDLISSAGAVIEGIGRTVMGIDDRSWLIDALRQTALLVLDDAQRAGVPPNVEARRRAQMRLDQAGR